VDINIGFSMREKGFSSRISHGAGCSAGGSAGISVISGSVATLERGNSSAIGNAISQCSRIARTYTPGVAFSGVGMYIANNTISDQPHTSITGGGNDNLFEYNTIRHSCYETIDTGAFCEHCRIPPAIFSVLCVLLIEQRPT
jgi:hypothetical protein